MVIQIKKKSTTFFCPTLHYEHIHEIKLCSTCQIWIFGGYVKARESLYARVIIGVNTILNILIVGGFAQVWRFLYGIQTQMVSKTKVPSHLHTLLVSKECEILIIDTQMVTKIDDIIPRGVRILSFRERLELFTLLNDTS